MPFRPAYVAVVVLAAGLGGCGTGVDLCGPEGCLGPPRPCAELPLGLVHWSLSGFQPADIVDPDLRNQRELTATLHVGQVKRLQVSGASVRSSEGNCRGLARTVEWLSSNPVVVRLTVEPDGRAASLLALQPGDVVVSANVELDDGTRMTIFPWSFTNVGSGDVTVIRVVP